MNFTRCGLVLVVFALLISACAPVFEFGLTPKTQNNHPLLKYLALGDSYTVGEGIRKEDSLPNQLVNALKEDGYSFGEPVVIARTGWTTDELIRALEDNPPEGTYDLVTLLIGVNNQFRGYSPAIYRSEFKELLYRSIQFAGNHSTCVIVLSIPDWGFTPFAEMMGLNRTQVSLEIDQFNQINQEEAEVAGVKYVNITAISRRAVDEPDLIAGDGLHPSGIMIQAWVEQILPEVKLCLNEKQKE
ncbi:MAG: SGNH/GDSL hydrolase family protein [Chloroflexota bacterium]|nr:MAG: lysophospholipase [Bellilinea sp.]